MRLICGFLRLDGGPADGALVRAMAAAMISPGLSPRVVWRVEGPAALAVLDFHPDGDRSPELASSPEGTLLAADVRLDRPRETAVALALPVETTPERLALSALERWGEASPDRLDGDYALASWNPHRRRLTLARDIFGVRPLCVWRRPGGMFAFASLPKGLHGSGIAPPELDLPALGRRVISIYDVSDATGYRNIGWLPAGHTLTVDADGTERLQCGWRPDPATVGTWRGSHAEAAETLRRLVSEAVACRLPTTGAVAAHLSGGLDSSTVAVLAARGLRSSGRRLAAFAFLAGPGADPKADADRPLVEAVLAQEAAIDCVEMHLQPADTLADADVDVRVAGHEIVNHINTIAAAATTGARLLLTGAGGDEGATYNGYQIHAELLRQGRWAALVADLPPRARRERQALWRVAAQRLVVPFLPGWAPELKRRWLGRPQLPGQARIFDLLHPDLRADVRASLAPLPVAWNNRPLHRIQAFNGSFLAPRNTWWSVLGARRGLAYAHPLLDRRIVDFTLSLPLEQFLHGGHSRQPFRDAMVGILPDPVRLQGVKGDAMPDSPRVLPLAKPALLEAAASLRNEPAAAAALDFDAITAAFAALPEPGQIAVGPCLRRAVAATRALSLARHLARST